MFTKQFKLTLASILLFVFAVALIAQVAILTFAVNNLQKTQVVKNVVTIMPTKAPMTTITATPSAGLKVVTPTKVVASPTKYIVAPTKVIVPVSATPAQ